MAGFDTQSKHKTESVEENQQVVAHNKLQRSNQAYTSIGEAESCRHYGRQRASKREQHKLRRWR